MSKISSILPASPTGRAPLLQRGYSRFNSCGGLLTQSTQKKRCNTCNKIKRVSAFPSGRFVNGIKEYPAKQCRVCQHQKYMKNSEYRKKFAIRVNSGSRRRRAKYNLEAREKIIFLDTKGSDRKRGLRNNLDKEFI